MFYRRESFRDFLKRYPFLSMIITVNVMVFFFIGLTNGIWGSYPIVLKGGILPDTIVNNEYWRFFTYAFLHDGLSHLVMNMFFLIIIAPPLEVMIGKFRMISLFLFTVFSTAFFVFVIGSQAGVGASGFGYGILGLYVYIVLYHKSFLDMSSRRIVLIWTAIGWVGTLIIPGISFFGHLGGFVGGFLFGLLTIKHHSMTPWSPQ
jgi:rhomboid protease GluP